ncbi:MAG: DUF465 domain-containing protein [Acidimicrobiia bacterium]|nr:DUF465 domain-containing protein [Acidimicrobiia bacterium]
MNAAESQHVRSHLLQTDDQYRQLATRHQELESRLHELTNKHYLTASEELEEVTLKKRKLALKDQMEAIARGAHRSP